MMNKMLICVAAMMMAATAAAAPGPGDAAPSFELPGSDGHTHRLQDLRGKFVVVAFFPKAYTSG